MEKKIMITSIGILTFLIGLFSLYNLSSKEETKTSKELTAVVLLNDQELLTIQDQDNIIYTIDNCNNSLKPGDNILLEYTGLLNKNKEFQDISISSCNTIYTMNEEEYSNDWDDNGIFSNYYKLAYQQVQELTLEEKIAQILLVRYPDTDAITDLKKYSFGGYIFFEKDFKDKTKQEVKTMMNDLQNASKIPILTAVDEEGGKVVRISSNSNLADEKFLSPSELYLEGGMNLIKTDTINKSTFLKDLGINLNLAPVVDVTTDPNAYMYERTIKEGTGITSTYAKTVIQASLGSGVSYVLKHFPGYGNNTDTHISSATDNRTYEEILDNDIPPFEAGIEAGAEAVLVSHNTVTSIDPDNPASLSASIHNLLRNQLSFTGIIITDDLSMSALNGISSPAVKAILAGNDLLISTNYEEDIQAISEAIENNTLSEETIEKLATRIIAWKYYKGLIIPNQK